MNSFNRIKYFADVYKTVKKYKYKSLFYRFWLFIIFALVAVLVLGSLFVSNYNNTKHYNNMSAIFSKNMYNMRNSVDSIFAEIIYETKAISENSEISVDGEITPETAMRIEKILTDINYESDFIKSVYVFYPKLNYVVSSSVIYKSAEIDKFEDSGWYDMYYNGASEVLLRSYPENALYQKCISVCKKLTGDNDGAVVVFNINYDNLNIIRKKNILMDYDIHIVNDSGMVIYSTDDEKIFKGIEQHKVLNDTYFLAAGNYTVNAKLADKVLCQSIRTKNVDLTIIAEIPKDSIDEISGNKSSIWLIFFAITILLVLVSIFIATKFYGTFMKLFEKIPFESLESQPQKTDEITDISKKITNILDKKSETEGELAQSLMDLQKAQSIALQSQFSPHFLFNTLQMINSIAISELNRDNDTTKAIKLLSDILHVAMDTTEYTCKFEDELELAKKYIMLQNMKYEDAFVVGFDIDDAVYDCTVTKLFLQPILENSMSHGYNVKNEKMHINIAAKIEDLKLVVTVEDDGVGMTEEREQQVIKNLNNKKLEKKNSIGLLNLNQRIKLICGFEYGCTICNNGNGVTVTITFPYR